MRRFHEPSKLLYMVEMNLRLLFSACRQHSKIVVTIQIKPRKQQISNDTWCLWVSCRWNLESWLLENETGDHFQRCAMWNMIHELKWVSVLLHSNCFRKSINYMFIKKLQFSLERPQKIIMIKNLSKLIRGYNIYTHNQIQRKCLIFITLPRR